MIVSAVLSAQKGSKWYANQLRNTESRPLGQVEELRLTRLPRNIHAFWYHAQMYRFIALIAACFVPVALSQDPLLKELQPLAPDLCSTDGIREAIEKSIYSARPTQSGFEAYNQAQELGIHFDRLGVMVSPNGKAWSWGLALQSYGFPDHMVTCDQTQGAHSAGKQVTYSWNNNLDEWFINDPQGLEHGYTFQEQPVRNQKESGPLLIELAVLGSLNPSTEVSGRGITFVDDSGQRVLSYSGLHVFDADGVPQRASFLGVHGGFQIRIEESGARYPLTVDPLVRQTYLKPLDTDASDMFGGAAAISGDVVVVGVPRESSNAVGVDGDASNNGSLVAGAAYVFRRTGGLWAEEAYLKASNTDAYDGFGSSVAIEGDLIVVGAPEESSSATGINGNQLSNAEQSSGAAYLFEKVGGAWTQVAYLKASNAEAPDRFGTSVAIDAQRILIGAPYESSSSPGINGNEADNARGDSGAAYLFERNGSSWIQSTYIKSPHPDWGDLFGDAVAISGDRILIGAYGEESSSSGVNSNPNTGVAHHNSGAAFVYERIAGAWTPTTYIKAPINHSGDRFGGAVAIADDRIFISAPMDGGAGTGIDPPVSSNQELASGAVFVYRPTVLPWWRLEAHIKAHNTHAGSQFGHSLDAVGNRLLVGAFGESRTGVNGDQTTTQAHGSGAAYSFVSSAGIWQQTRYIKASNEGQNDGFGSSVALTPERAIIGAWGEASASTGVNGDRDDNSTPYAGAAYVFNWVDQGQLYCGPANTNSLGVSATMWVSGSALISDNDFNVGTNSVPPSVFAYYLSSKGQDYVPMLNGSQGNLCLGGGLPLGRHRETLQLSTPVYSTNARMDLSAVAAGSGSSSIAPGETWNFQCWYRDKNPNSTSNFSDAISVQFE